MTKTLFRKIVLEINYIFFFLTQVPFVYMERVGFMTCTAASHQGAIKEPAASLFRTCEAHPSKVRRPCQSTIVGAACAELHHSDRNLRTAWFEKGDFKIGIFKKKHWVDFYHHRMDVYTHFQHTFMFKQLVKLILHPMTPLNVLTSHFSAVHTD